MAASQTSYRITLGSPDQSTTNAATSFVDASITWP